MEGYWRHPGFVLLGTLQHAGLVQRIQSVQECAAQCDAQRSVCDAFAYTAHDRICRLQRGTIKGICKIGEVGCVDPGVKTYYRDSEHM